MKSRSLMIFLLFVGYVVVYIDKTVMGFALLPIEREFSLQPQQLGYITGMFFLAYSLFQIPAGWLNDRFGYKKVLAISLFLLGGFALCFGALGFGLGLLVTFRFLSGIGHSGYPCSCAKAVVSNFALEQRTFAQSILLSSAGLAVTAGLCLFLGYVFLMASFVTVFTLPMKRLPAEVMGAAMGLINTGGTLGGFVAPIAMGYLISVSHGYLSTFIFLALAMVVAGLAILPLAMKPRATLRDAA